MPSSASTENKLLLDLIDVLQKNANRVLSGEINLCLTTSSLSVLASSFHLYSETKFVDEPGSSGQGRGSNGRQTLDLKKWRDNMKILNDFVLNIKALKIIHCVSTLTVPIEIAKFRSVQVLEVRKVPIHMLEGLSNLRGQLREIIITKSINTLKDLFEVCGGDQTPGLTWSNLKTARLSFNGLHNLDHSLNFAMFIEVLDLSHNNLIQSETFLHPLTDLMRVNLGFNKLTSFPSFPSSCKLMLKTLILRNNSLDSLDGIQEMQVLEELDVSENLLVDHTVLHVLLGLNKLQVLCLVGNPLSYKTDHRLLTVKYISAQAGLAIFLLDSKRLSSEELNVLHQKQCRTMNTLQQAVSNLNTTGAVIDIVDGSVVSVTHLSSSHPREKKKRGHRNMQSKERIPKIVDIAEGQTGDSALQFERRGSLLPSSFVEHADFLAQIEDDKQQFEIMRQHYRDDWLKAWSLRQALLNEPQEDSQSSEQESLMEHKQDILNLQPSVSAIIQQSPVQEKQISDQKQFFAKKPLVLDKLNQKVNEKLKVGPSDDSGTHDYNEPEIVPTTVITMTSPTSPPPAQIEAFTDIYASIKGKSISKQPSDHKKNEVMLHSQISGEDGLSFEDADNYGNESDPFIVMLPTDDMKQFFVTVNDRYIIEKNLNGVKLGSLDLKCLQSIQKTEEACFGKDIIGGFTYTILTLNFDFVLKNKRLRKYAMEDEEEAQKFESLIAPHLKTHVVTKDVIMCLKCHYEFEEMVSQDTSPATECPKCKSKMVVKSEKVQIFTTSPTPSPCGSYQVDSDIEERLKTFPNKSPKCSPKLTRKKAIKHKTPKTIAIPEISDKIPGKKGLNVCVSKKIEQSSSLKNTNIYSDVDILKCSSMSEAALRTNASWSDLRQSSYRSFNIGSLTSLESDIAVLESNSTSVTMVTESSTPHSNHQYNIIPPILDTVSDSAAVNKQRKQPRIIISEGAPLSSGVCSSMVSSVYETTLSGVGEDREHELSENLKLKGNCMECSKESVMLRQSRDIEHSASKNYRNTVVCDEQVIYSNNEIDSVNIGRHSLPKSDSHVSAQFYSSPSESQISRSLKMLPPVIEMPSNTESGENSLPPLRRVDKSVRSVNSRYAVYGDIQSTDTDMSELLSHLPAIQKSSPSRKTQGGKIIDDEIRISELDSYGDKNSIVLSESESANACHKKQEKVLLPWEQKIEAVGAKDECLNHDEFVNLDHRLQLHLELKELGADDTCQCAIQCGILQYMNPTEIKSLFLISTSRILIFKLEGESYSHADWLKCYENQPITDLHYIDIGLGYQSLRLEFETECSSYTLLIADEGRCKKFLTLLTHIVQTSAMNDQSKLEGISKTLPTTMDNLEKQVLNPLSTDVRQPQHLVRYLMIKYTEKDGDQESAETMSLVITQTDIILVKENHQWPLPRLQASLSESLKGKQFTVIQREKINNIETVMFNEDNPKELHLTFFEANDTTTNSSKSVWMITMETLRGVKSLVDAIREPWEEEFKLSFDTYITPKSFFKHD